MKPHKIHLHKRSGQLDLMYASDTFQLSAEYLRVHSPSAEVKGHGSGPKQLVSGKQGLAIEALKPVGHYGLQLIFSDGHDSGIFTWPYLYDLSQHHERYWQQYLQDLKTKGKHREADISAIRFTP